MFPIKRRRYSRRRGLNPAHKTLVLSYDAWVFVQTSVCGDPTCSVTCVGSHLCLSICWCRCWRRGKRPTRCAGSRRKRLRARQSSHPQSSSASRLQSWGGSRGWVVAARNSLRQCCNSREAADCPAVALPEPLGDGLHVGNEHLVKVVMPPIRQHMCHEPTPVRRLCCFPVPPAVMDLSRLGPLGR